MGWEGGVPGEGGTGRGEWEGGVRRRSTRRGKSGGGEGGVGRRRTERGRNGERQVGGWGEEEYQEREERGEEEEGPRWRGMWKRERRGEELKEKVRVRDEWGS